MWHGVDSAKAKVEKLNVLIKTTLQVPGAPTDIGVLKKHLKVQAKLESVLSYFESSQSMVQLIGSFSSTGEVGRVAVGTTGEVTVGNKSISMTKWTLIYMSPK
jgi:hypothetical protein